MKYRWLAILGLTSCVAACGGGGSGDGGNGGDGGDGSAGLDGAGGDASLDARIDGTGTRDVISTGDGAGTRDGVSTGDGSGTRDVASADAPVSCASGGACPAMQFCSMGVCVPDYGPCANDDDCENDSHCVLPDGRCTPYTPGGSDPTCTRRVQPGVFAPALQCRFSDPPAGDPFPLHGHVLSTPMVADLKVYAAPGAPSHPSIIAVFDDGVDGSSELPTGLIRILDGQTCALQDNLSEEMTSHSSPPAVADLDNDGTPEIVAFKANGGLVAFRYTPAGTSGTTQGWHVWWRSTNTDGTTPYEPTGGGWAGPSVVDLDDDGFPEVIRHGSAFDGRTGRLIGGTSVYGVLTGYVEGEFSIVLDVDEDGLPELVTAVGVYAWDNTAHDWVIEPYYHADGCGGGGCGMGFSAVGNFGDYPGTMFTDPGLPEIAVVSGGAARIDTIEGHTVFGPVALPGGGNGGPPAVADFDGDGLDEIAAAGATAYSVFDPDCTPTPRPGGRCPSGSTNGVSWSSVTQDSSSNVTGSTSFDFEADGKVEAVYADECFARVYDGATGAVLFSQQSSSCTWYENPVVADVDGDLKAEIVVASNFNCGSDTTGIACPGVDVRNTDTQFVGIRCFANGDCPSNVCDNGFCRCTDDTQCCPGSGTCTYVCTTPPAGTPGTGNTCRASRPQGVHGISVYADVADRWVRSRTIWNQHAYDVTNVDDDARIPRTSAVPRNWRDPTLNNFRTNVQGIAPTDMQPDATDSGSRFTCDPAGPAMLFAEVCNRGTAPLPAGTAAGFWDGSPTAGGTLVCTTTTQQSLQPGQCVEVSCMWSVPPSTMARTIWVRIDETRTTSECREQNNIGTIERVFCPPPG